MFQCSRSSLRPFVLCLAGLFWAPEAPAAPAPPPRLLVDTFSVSEIVATARQVPFGGTLRLEGVTLDGASEALALERFRVFSPDAEIVVHGEAGPRNRPVPNNRYFRGRVVGAPDSLALLTVLEAGMVRGMVWRDGTLYELGGETTGPADSSGSSGIDPRLASRAIDGPRATDDAFECAAGDLPAVTGAEDLQRTVMGSALGERAQASYYSARVAVETDWEFFQRFGNETDAMDYVADLVAYSSSIYDREIDTELYLSHVSLWNHSDDPWTQSSTSCALYEFGQYWNAHHGDVDRTIAHFMSGKNNGGGIAWLGVLCQGGFDVYLNNVCPDLSPRTDEYGGAYGYTGDMDTNFDPTNPSPVWDIVAVSHEIGHNFDSPHTHCYNGIGGSPEPVDECYGSEAGCYAGATSLPCPSGEAGCGTIMSYCHLLGGLSNISLTLGADDPWGTFPYRVPDRMRAHADAVAQGSTCLERITPCTDLTLENETVNKVETYEACGTVRAGNGFHVAEPDGDVTLMGERVILESGFIVESGARLTVDPE